MPDTSIEDFIVTPRFLPYSHRDDNRHMKQLVHRSHVFAWLC